jgi:NADH-quinone oxidoreductase subunit L
MSLAAARLVVLLPALAAAAGLFLARRGTGAVRLVAVGFSLATLVAALAGLVSVGGSSNVQTARTLPALEAGALEVPLLLQTSALPALVAAVVALVGWAVQAFAAWYLRDDDRYGVFAATVSLFCAGMLLVVHSADLVLTFVGWEVMGWCSYLLIGHWSRKESARRAALKAFLVTRFADVGFLLGVLALASGPGSTAYARVLPTGPRPPAPTRVPVPLRAMRCGPWRWCCCSWASSASPPSSPSTTGSPTPWRARPRRPR